MSNAFTAEVHCSSPLSKDTVILQIQTESVPQSAKSSKCNIEEKIPFIDGDVHDGLDNSDISDEFLPSVEEENGNHEKRMDESVLNYSGMKQMLKTPLVFHSKDTDLSGLSNLFDSPKTAGLEAELPTVSKESLCVSKESLCVSEEPLCVSEESLSIAKNSPSVSKNSPSISYTGIRKLLQTPKPDPCISYLGIKETLQTPQHSSVVSLVGVKELVATPKGGDMISLVGLKEMVQTPKPAHIISLDGVKELMDTPKILKDDNIAEIAAKDMTNEENIPVQIPTRMTRCRAKAIEMEPPVVEPEVIYINHLTKGKRLEHSSFIILFF